MRPVLLAALISLAGCQAILGIEDPNPLVADDDIADDDGPPPGDGGIDAPMIDAIPPDGPPGTCDILDPQTCTGGTACDYSADTMTIDCRAAADVPAMTSCTVSTECNALQTCYHGACRGYCNGDGDCQAPQDHCHDLKHPSGVFVCDSRCQWWAPADGGCGDGYHCRLAVIGDGTGDEMSAECVPGLAGSIPPTGGCGTAEECVAGAACLNDGSGNFCYQLCNVDAPTCPGAQICNPLGGTGGGALTVHSTPVGVCTGG